MFNIYLDCCKTILVKIEGMALPFTCKWSGVKNGNPMWRNREGYEIYHENERWIIGNGPYGRNEKYFISDSSDECPESVESWSNHGPHGLKLEGGKIECDSTL